MLHDKNRNREIARKSRKNLFQRFGPAGGDSNGDNLGSHGRCRERCGIHPGWWLATLKRSFARLSGGADLFDQIVLNVRYVERHGVQAFGNVIEGTGAQRVESCLCTPSQWKR